MAPTMRTAPPQAVSNRPAEPKRRRRADLTLRGPAFEWTRWGTTIRIATHDPHTLPAVRRVVQRELEAVERAVGPCGSDADPVQFAGGPGRPVRVSATCAAVLGAALAMAFDSDGDLDCTWPDALVPLQLTAPGHAVRATSLPGVVVRVVPVPPPGWRQVTCDADALTVKVPAGVRLDLSSAARAWAADRCAAAVEQEIGIPVLVAIGGDIATAGSARSGDWTVLVHDHRTELARSLGPDHGRDVGPEVGGAGSAALVTLPPGGSLSTTGNASRHRRDRADEMQAILRPHTRRTRHGDDEREWRAVTVVAGSCVEAATWSAAALLRGPAAVPALESRGLSARLVDVTGTAAYAGSWPAAAELGSRVA